MATKFPITKSEFREFLHTRESLRLGNGANCPIAAAVLQKFGGKRKVYSVTTGSTHTTILRNKNLAETFIHPKWVSAFIQSFDNKEIEEEVQTKRRITTKRRIAVARSVLR